MTTELTTQTTPTELAHVAPDMSVSFVKGKNVVSRNADTALLLGGKARAAALDEVEAAMLRKAHSGRPESAAQFLLDRFPKIVDAFNLTKPGNWRDMASAGCKDRFADVCQAVLCHPVKKETKNTKQAQTIARAYLRTEGLVVRADFETIIDAK